MENRPGASGNVGSTAVASLNAEVHRVLALPEARDKTAGTGVEVLDEPPDAFAAAPRSVAERWVKAIRVLDMPMSDA